ncbi:extracellular solute-binding protein [Fodinicurvata sp. EGI_FJ10296]|uniref:extracellular solute-binding protein n=1 Tax=Fodinicurvata sp. EGI_FJ10296 TaxID=3231908 RepID=UPI0034558EFA
MSKFQTTRRGFIKNSSIGASILAAPAIIRSRSAFSQNNVVNVWTYANFIPDAFREQFQDETGIEIRIRLVEDQGQQFNLLAAEAPEPSVDLMTIAGHRFRQFIDSDLLVPIDEDRLQNWSTVNPIYRDSDWIVINGEKWGVPILTGAEVLAWNTEIVDESETRSWDVMFDPKYRGQTAYIIQDMMSVAMLYLGYDGNMIEYMGDRERAQEIVNETRDFLIEHKDMVRNFYSAGAEVQQMFVNQDIVLAHAWSGPISRLIMDGFPVDMTIPQEGTYGFVYNFNVTNNAPNEENAYRLLDAILASPEVGAAMTRASGFISTFRGVEQHLTELEQQASSFTEEELSGLRFFRADANEMKYELVDPAVEEIQAG